MTGPSLVPGSWRLNLFTGAIVVVLVMLSLILTMSVLFPGISEGTIVSILIGGSILAIITTIGAKLMLGTWASVKARHSAALDESLKHARDAWRMPPLDQLPPAQLTSLERVWLIVLRGYLVVAGGLVLVRIVMLAGGA
jgi:hypothetical protein